MEKMKINIFAMHLAYGGVEKAVSAMANLFAEKGYLVKLYCTYDMPKAPAYDIDSRVEIKYLLKDTPNRAEFNESLASKNVLRILKEGFRSVKILFLKKYCIKREIKKIHEGIIITTRHEDSLILSKYGDKKVYKIAQLHHDHNFDKKLVNDFKYKYENIDCFALLTDQLRDEIAKIMKEGNNTHTKCVTIPNFVDSISKPCILEEKEPYCISVGRLHPVKGFDRLIDAFVMIHESCPNYTLKIVGDGSEMPFLKQKVKQLSMENCISFTGAKTEKEVNELMRNASLYLMTSYSEGLPFVLIEAQQNKLPCVAFDVRVGPRGVITDKENGYLVPDGDTLLFTEKAVSLLTNKTLRNTFSEQAYIAAKKFTKDEVSKTWEKVLRKEFDII